MPHAKVPILYLSTKDTSSWSPSQTVSRNPRNPKIFANFGQHCAPLHYPSLLSTLASWQWSTHETMITGSPSSPAQEGEKQWTECCGRCKNCASLGSINLHTYIAKTYEMQFQLFKCKSQGESSKQSPSWASKLSQGSKRMDRLVWCSRLKKLLLESQIFL